MEHPKDTKENTKWKVANATILKVNWDAAMCNKIKNMGLGIILRDYSGAVLDCLSSSRNFSSLVHCCRFLGIMESYEILC